MARVSKIDNAIKKRFERIETNRAVNTRSKRVYFLIVCEGSKTEPNYFKALEKELPQGTVELKIAGTGRNTLGLIDYTIKQRDLAYRTYDRVWAVFDKDDFPHDNFNNAISKAKSHDINCAWSNEAFELWFLLHFQYVNTGMKREDYKAFLEREIKKHPNNTNYVYTKNDVNSFSVLKSYGNQTQAIEWAKQLRQNYTDECYAAHNPCTYVDVLIDELYNSQELLKKIEGNKK
jgi:hypothetical protein